MARVIGEAGSTRPVASQHADPRADAKELICEILRASKGRLSGMTRLSKAFYIAHLHYYQRTGKILTDHPIVRMTYGPGIDDYRALLAELVKEGRVKIERVTDGLYPEYLFVLEKSPHPSCDPERSAAIKDAVQWVVGKRAVELSEITHRSRSWQAVEDGESMNIYLDLLLDDEVEGFNRGMHEVKQLVESVFRHDP